MSKQRTVRIALAAAIAVAVSIPLIGQVRRAQSAANTASDPSASSVAAAAEPESAAPATKPAEVDPNKVIVTQGDVTVTAGEFAAVVAGLPPQYQAAMSDPAIKKRIADRLVQVKQIAAEARRRNIQDKPQVKQQIEMQADQVLVNALMQDIQGGQNDKDERAYYDANKSNFDNVKARHILIRTTGSPVPLEPGKKDLSDADAKAKADQIEQRLAKGEDFATIAKAESDDKGSGVKGGDLGTFAPWRMDTVFSKATLGLQKNQISEPVKTQFGYHIIQLLDDAPRTYDEAKTEVGEARWNQLVSSLSAGAKPEYDPSFFGTTADKPAGPTTQPAAAHLSSNH